MLYPISVPKPNHAEDVIGFINVEGRVIVRPKYMGGSYFFEGKASVVDEDGKSGFIDCDGNLALPCHFRGLGKFKDGLCSIGGGFINHSGAWVIKPRFAVASHFSEGRAFASLDGEAFGFIDLSGEFAISPRFEQCSVFSHGLAAVYCDGCWGYIDHSGEVRIPFVFEGSSARRFRYGLAGVQIDGRWGFVDESGGFVIKPQYDNVKDFSEGYAAVQRDQKWGVIDIEGNLAVDFQFDDLGEFTGGTASAEIEGNAGFVLPTGTWVIRPEFKKCYRFYGRLAVVRLGDVYKYIRRDGSAVWTSESGAMVQAPPVPL